MLDRDSSLRLDLLRFPLIVGIVFLHTFGIRIGFSGGKPGISHQFFIADFIIHFVSQGIARVAVPVFFLMSGYLFFWGFVWSKEGYLNKIKRRIKTLLIPFLFWNIATLLFVGTAQAVPALHSFFSGKNPLISTFGFFDYFNAIIGLTQRPIAYQFWFVRDLIILILLAPLIHVVNRYLSLAFLGLVFICWLINVWPVYMPSSEAFLFFSVGGYLASKKKNLFYFDNYGAIIIILYLAIVTMDVLTIKKSFNPYLHNIGILLGISAALFTTKFIAQSVRLKKAIVGLSSASFFVYAIHAPLLTILKKIALKTIPAGSSSAILVSYFLVPFTIIFLAIAVYRGLIRVVPRFASIVTGGRS